MRSDHTKTLKLCQPSSSRFVPDLRCRSRTVGSALRERAYFLCPNPPVLLGPEVFHSFLRGATNENPKLVRKP